MVWDRRSYVNEYWAGASDYFSGCAVGDLLSLLDPAAAGVCGYLFYRNKEWFFRYALSFLLVNLLGFVIYYVCPAAPPWYVQEYGLGSIPIRRVMWRGWGGSTAFSIGIFSALYSKSSNVFAAMPSLHASYPLTVLYYGMKYRLGRINILFAAIMAGIWFAAVYSGHHYVLDVLAGIGCGLAGDRACSISSI